ncbi:hypothetical protein CMV37_12520 [Bacillus cereus]|nr:hypothetical protein CMV37_12520 [Bacillus cereus]
MKSQVNIFSTYQQKLPLYDSNDLKTKTNIEITEPVVKATKKKIMPITFKLHLVLAGLIREIIV